MGDRQRQTEEMKEGVGRSMQQGAGGSGSKKQEVRRSRKEETIGFGRAGSKVEDGSLVTFPAGALQVSCTGGLFQDRRKQAGREDELWSEGVFDHQDTR